MAEPQPVRYRIESSRSRVVVRTRATGMLAKLAHDLEIESRAVEGDATSEGDAWTATLRVGAASLRVEGALHGDRLDRSALKDSDRAEIERRLRADVLSGVSEVTVRGSGASIQAGEAVVEAGRRPATFDVRLDVRRSDGGSVAATARVTVKLSRLGVPEIKGPLGAFRVRDDVEVVAELELVPV